MSKRTKIAPVLRQFVACPWDAGWRPDHRSATAGPLSAQALRELRALLGCARALRRLLRDGNYRMKYRTWSALVDADARLARLSSPSTRRGGFAGPGSTVEGSDKPGRNSAPSTRRERRRP